MTILIKNQQRLRRLNKKKIKKAALKILSILEQTAAELSILFVDDKKMQQLNTAFRGIKRTTDILSFPQISEKWEVRSKKLKNKKIETPFTSHFLFPTPHFLLGDVVISVPTAVAQAKNSGTGFYDEILRLLIHGVLHLLGYNHETSRYKGKVMRKKEKEILNAFKKMG